MKSVIKKITKYGVIALCIITLGYGVLILVVRPSLSRNWNPDQILLSESTFNGSEVTIKNIRNNKYRTTTDYDVRYYDKTFDLDKLESVWFMVEPFSGHGFGAAHTLISFGFSDGEYVSISVEIRKEKGESFSAVKGLFRQYEIVYVVADEQDVIKLRSNFRKDTVYLYPVNTIKENMRELFVSMLKKANKLAKEPEFYNTLTNTCTTNIVTHVNEIAPNRIPLSFKVLMPAYSDELAQKVGLIDSSVSIEELRAKYQINEKAEKYANDPSWSSKIRE